jgi:hypothetical protein
VPKDKFEPSDDSEKIYLFINLRCLFIDLPWLKKKKYLPINFILETIQDLDFSLCIQT